MYALAIFTAKPLTDKNVIKLVTLSNLGGHNNIVLGAIDAVSNLSFSHCKSFVVTALVCGISYTIINACYMFSFKYDIMLHCVKYKWTNK